MKHRAWLSLLVVVVLVAAGVSAERNPAKSKTKKQPAAQKNVVKSASPEARTAKSTTPKVSDPSTASATSEKSSARTASANGASEHVSAAQGSRGGGSASDNGREWIPMPATTGPLGLFTVETGELLPQKSFSVSGYANRFAREPGTLTVLNLGWSFAVGLHDRANVFINWEPYRHIHVSHPNRLSFNTPLANPQFGSTIYRSLVPLPGAAPGYAEDFPFVSREAAGAGEIVLGTRFGITSERWGNGANFSLGYDFFIPTVTQLSDLLDNQVQLGTWSHGPNASLSKTWNNFVQTTFSGSYRFTRNHKFGLSTPAFEMADQLRVGAGMLFFPDRRWQIMNEYTGLIFLGDSTPTTTFGARDPVDGVIGARLYMGPYRNVALDLGYRYMLNLRAHGDRNGFVIKLGAVSWPEKPKPVNRGPMAACSADKGSVNAGSDESVMVTMRASDPDGDTLSYDWRASGGQLQPNGPQARWSSAGLQPGMYTITGTTNDGQGGTATCAVDIRVEPRPNRAPSLTCSAERSSVLTGERVGIRGVASDPDGDTLTYSWRSNDGQIVGSGANVQLDTSGLAPGNYMVTGRVEDGRGLAADCSVAVGVQQPPPPPQSSKLNECFFRQGSARVDNVCKRIMDDVALRLQNDPRARVVIVGYADPKEARPDRLAQQRADNSKAYLVSKGIAASRVDARPAGGQAGADKQNRRVDVIWVPEGATY